MTEISVEDAGAASGIINAIHQLGGSLGLGTLVAVFAAAGTDAQGAQDMFVQHVSATLQASTAIANYEERVAIYGEAQQSFASNGFICGRVTLQPFAKGKTRRPLPTDKAARPTYFAKRDVGDMPSSSIRRENCIGRATKSAW